jgi:hypothetical protein
VEQFFHQPNPSSQKYTVCVDIPPKEEFLELLLNPHTKLELNCGLALCSPQDNYNKKIGRNLSSSRKLSTEFACVGIFGNVELIEKVYRQFHIFILESKDLSITVNVRHDHSRAMFVHAELK